MANQKRTLAEMFFAGNKEFGKVFNVAVEFKDSENTEERGLYLHVRPMFVESLGDTVRRGRLTPRGAIDKIKAVTDFNQADFDNFKVDRSQVERLVKRFTDKYKFETPCFDNHAEIFA